MTWATPFGSEVAQVRSPGSLHNRWCCDPELKPPPFFFRRGAWSVSVAGSERPCMPPLTGAWAGGLSAAGWRQCRDRGR
ncbi:hypothetical protein BRM42_21340 [Xanthomonas oryzae pv. oryzae]|nr:hypothetical protein BRM42_21340 [Xanthomonas oryzae pv. oryzae]